MSLEDVSVLMDMIVADDQIEVGSQISIRLPIDRTRTRTRSGSLTLSLSLGLGLDRP
jgi:hypothetical protein